MEIVNPISLSLVKQESESLNISVEAPIVLTTTQNGLARGYSAYEIAVKNGFEGTEAEWLASLKDVSMEDVSFAPYKDITETNGQNAIQQLRDLSVEDSSNEDASVLSINLEIEVQNINLTSGTGDLDLSLSSLPIKNGTKSVIVNNSRGTDVNIIYPTESITSGGINYIYHYTDEQLTVLNGYSGEIMYRFHFLDKTNCQIRIAGVPFDYKST